MNKVEYYIISLHMFIYCRSQTEIKGQRHHKVSLKKKILLFELKFFELFRDVKRKIL
jgi:hypothetical protein